MKKVFTTLTLAFLAFTFAFAQEASVALLNSKQVSKIDVSGKWIGKRYQYSWDRQSIIETFEYEFELKQSGNIVSGVSTIISSNGDYADMVIEGTIIGNVFYFAEKSVKNAARPEGKVWCFKNGGLNFKLNGDNLQLTGETSSNMEGTNYPCSGGVTVLTKVDNSNNTALLKSDFSTKATSNPNMNISIYPNPFVENANISYNLTTDAHVITEVYDISGKLVSKLFDGNQKIGNYNVVFNSKNNGYFSGIFIVKMTVNDEIFSSQIVQMK
jgi:hypothetical protein